MIHQQGDVLFELINGIPKEAVKNPKEIRRSRGNPVLAEGEATGHAHVLEAPDIDVFKLHDDIFFSLDKESQVVHEEHKTTTLPKGDYRSWHVKEYDHFAEEARKVQD